MPAFSSLSKDDRWGLTHFVLSLGPAPLADSAADLKSVGAGAGGGGSDEALPIDFVIDQMAID